MNVSISNNAFQEVFQVLDEMEDTWTADQKKAKKDRLKATMEKGRREGELYGIVLRKCKLHDGPLTSVNELQTFLKTQKENKEKKKLLRLEIQYQRSHQRDCQDRPDLYKVNGLTEEEIIANLATLLASDSVDEKAEDLIFDSEDQIMSILKAETIICERTKKYSPLDPVIVTWHHR